MPLFKNIFEFISWFWFRSQGLITNFIASQIIFYSLESFIRDYYNINIIEKYTGWNLTVVQLLDIWFFYFILNSIGIRIAEKVGKPLTPFLYEQMTLTFINIKKWLLLL